MRIHTSLDPDAIRAMLAGMPGVTFERFTVHGSRTHPRAVEVLLSGTSPRRRNFGNRGAGDDYAATWDEWGIFLGRLFRADPEARATYYRDAYGFDCRTTYRFDESFTVEDQHPLHRWESDGNGAQHCPCGATRRWAV